MQMSECAGCAQFFKWLDVAIVHQGRTKGFNGSEEILERTRRHGWSAANVVQAYYLNEKKNATRIWADSKKAPGVTEVEYVGKKPYHGPASVFVMHSNELDRLAEEYAEQITCVESRKAKRRTAKRPFLQDSKKAMTLKELQGALGEHLKVAGRPIREFVVVEEGEAVG